MRLTQSLFEPGVVRLHCFVDDPIASIRGTPLKRKLAVATMILTWEALGFGLAYKKGQLGKSVTWIGGTLSVNADGIRGEVKAAIVEDIIAALEKFEGTNVLSKKEVRSFVGRANHAAGLLVALRPFLHQIWAALSAPTAGPPNTIWTKQIRHATSWLRAFFAHDLPGISRQFSLQEFRGAGPVMEIGTDASPWGLGGWLSMNGTITHYFACPVSNEDLHIFDIERGSCTAQQTLEGLAMLVAMRLWSDVHSSRRYTLQMRGDNVGALSLLLRMRPSSPQQAIIARELALHTVHYAFPPRVTHTPGLAHVIADALSRCYDPGIDKVGILSHHALKSAVRTDVPTRGRSWYKTLGNFER